jgi:hypothetical protein
MIEGKRGELLVQNIIFIILNLMFLSILVLFLIKQSSGAVFLEDSYSKQIALMVDAAKPGTKIYFNMDKAMKVAKGNGIDFKDVVSKDGNFVRVQLSDKSGKEYSFFNDVEVNFFPQEDQVNSEYTGIYVITVDRKIMTQEDGNNEE